MMNRPPASVMDTLDEKVPTNPTTPPDSTVRPNEPHRRSNPSPDGEDNIRHRSNLVRDESGRIVKNDRKVPHPPQVKIKHG